MEWRRSRPSRDAGPGSASTAAPFLRAPACAAARRLRLRRRPLLRDSFHLQSPRFFHLSSELMPLLPTGCGCSGGSEVLNCCAPTTSPRDGIVRVLASDVTRRKFLGACCATGFGIVASGPLAAIVAACGSELGATAASTLRVGHLPAGCIQHLLLAQINGLFKKAGLNVVLTQFNGPPPNLQSLVTGAIDVSHNPWTTVIAAYNDGQKDLRIIGGSGKGGIELVAREGSVRNVAELAASANKGLKVGTLRLDTLEVVTYRTPRDAGRG